MSEDGQANPDGRPLWARVGSGVVIGLIAGTLLAVPVVGLAAALMMWPSLSPGRVWSAAGRLIAMLYVVTVIHGIVRQAGRGGPA